VLAVRPHIQRIRRAHRCNGVGHGAVEENAAAYLRRQSARSRDLRMIEAVHRTAFRRDRSANDAHDLALDCRTLELHEHLRAPLDHGERLRERRDERESAHRKPLQLVERERVYALAHEPP